MRFNDQVKATHNEPELIAPSAWHIFYWLKWYFVIRPKLIKEINKAKDELVDRILSSDFLRERIK